MFSKIKAWLSADIHLPVKVKNPNQTIFNKSWKSWYFTISIEDKSYIEVVVKYRNQRQDLIGLFQFRLVVVDNSISSLEFQKFASGDELTAAVFLSAINQVLMEFQIKNLGQMPEKILSNSVFKDWMKKNRLFHNGHFGIVNFQNIGRRKTQVGAVLISLIKEHSVL